MKKFKAITKPLMRVVGKNALDRWGVEGATVSAAKEFGREFGEHAD